MAVRPQRAVASTHVPFAKRVAEVRAARGPLVLGLDPAAKTLTAWALTDDAEGLERFVDTALEVAIARVGFVKAQAAFFERHGWRGMRSLERLIGEARHAGLVVILDAKRGDVGSTNEAYAAAYLGSEAPMPADAVTVSPCLGVAALRPFYERVEATGAGLFVVARSTNIEGRDLQRARQADGTAVEDSILAALAQENERVAPGGVGPFGAVFAAAHGPSSSDLERVGGLFLCPGVGAQGTTPTQVATCFASCPERVLPSASRALLEHGPDPYRFADAVGRLAEEMVGALAAVGG